MECRICGIAPADRDHHHHFCFLCLVFVLPGEEEKQHLSTNPNETTKRPKTDSYHGHRIQFCPRCAPPVQLDPSSKVARYADFLHQRWGGSIESILEAERAHFTTKGNERLVPTGVRMHFPHPFTGNSPSTMLERCGPIFLHHPGFPAVLKELSLLARESNEATAEWARSEILAIAAALLGETAPKRRLGKDFNRWLMESFDQLTKEGLGVKAARVRLGNWTGLSFGAVGQRLAAARRLAGAPRRRDRRT